LVFGFYLHQDFQVALAILDDLMEKTPNDPVVALLSRKCQAFLGEPAPPDWNGATALDEK